MLPNWCSSLQKPSEVGSVNAGGKEARTTCCCQSEGPMLRGCKQLGERKSLLFTRLQSPLVPHLGRAQQGAVGKAESDLQNSSPGVTKQRG